MFEEKKKKILTYEQAFKKGEAYCAYQERCQQEVRNKLYEWGLYKNDVENIIAKLVINGYIICHYVEKKNNPPPVVVSASARIGCQYSPGQVAPWIFGEPCSGASWDVPSDPEGH